MHPKYSLDTNPGPWAQEAVNLAAMPSSTAHPTLMFYTTGPTSSHIAQILRDHAGDAVSRDQAVYAFFKPYISRLPNYSSEDSRCQPSAILATAWENDEHAGYGSYTNFPVGLEAADEDLEVLSKGMPERGVWLAGEHCAPYVTLGTLTGARASGEHVAKLICEAWQIE